MPQTIGENKVDNKETGGNEDPHKDIKDEWPKAQATILATPASIVDRSDTLPGTALKDKGQELNLT